MKATNPDDQALLDAADRLQLSRKPAVRATAKRIIKATKRPTSAEVRRQALLDARATVRADILLDHEMTLPETLDRITKSIDQLIDKT